jgi:hypothetical protein
MAKVGLSKLNLNKKQDIKVIQFEGNDIEIIQYLDIASKSSLVSAAVRGSVIGGIVDEILLDAYLHLFIIDKYTNISLTQKQRDNLLDTFDILESNKFFDLIIEAMAQNEYEYIFTMAKRLMNNLNEYNKGLTSILQGFEEVIQQFANQAQSKLDK